MNSPIKHFLQIPVTTPTSEPVDKAWCTCGWSYRCSLGWQTALEQAREHAIMSTYEPPSGRINMRRKAT